MISVPANVIEALGVSYSSDLVVELTTGKKSYELDVADYTVTADDSSVSRYTVDLTLSPETDPQLIRPYGATVRCWHRCSPAGIASVDIPAGVYRLVSRSLNLPTGHRQVQGVGFETLIDRDKFTAPRSVTGSSTIECIKTLIRQTDPTALFDERATHDKSVPPVSYDAERWGAVRSDDNSLALSIGAVVYYDARGRWRIENSPTLDDAVVWRCTEGIGGALVTADDTITDADVINVWVVTGTRTDGSPMARAIVSDDDRSSPTYALGESWATGDSFGRYTGFFDSPLFESNGQAERAGRVKLATSTGLSEALSLTASPHPGLEVGDVFTTVAGEVFSTRIASSITWSSGAMSVSTRVVRRDYL